MLLPRFRIRTLMIVVAAATLVLYVGVLSRRRASYLVHAESLSQQHYFATAELLELVNNWREPPSGYREMRSQAETEVRRLDKLVQDYTYAADHPWLSLTTSPSE